MIKKLLIFSLMLSALSSCKPAIKPESLYGRWKYIKVENPNASPPDSVPRMVLEDNRPYIEFTAPGDVSISWGGKILSHGTFTVDGSNINIKEELAGGKTREFPFYVSELSEIKIIFETTGTDGSRVTAIKQ